MGTRLLLADDHAILRSGLRMLLETQPDIQIVGEAANGREAVQQAQLLCPDVVVIDIAMPELNGIEATAQIREVCPATQFVILSMYSSAEHVFRAFQAGALGYVLKESADVELFQAIRAVRAGQQYVSEKVVETSLDSSLHSDQVKSPLERLSAREREILQLTAEGKSSPEIATMLSLSRKTVETYRTRTMRKLGLSDFLSLLKFAIKHGLTPPN
jgi:RNA polymerase sigma factor (sigma-70 family)